MTFDLDALLRDNIRTLVPYSSARSECEGRADVHLDANESPFDWGGEARWNRYPDPRQVELRKAIARYRGIDERCVLTVNGSDEAIDLLIRAVCRPGRDRILSVSPSYGMYSVAAKVNDAACDSVPLEADFSLDFERLWAAVTSETRLIFLCSPNNPTGNIFAREELLWLAERFEGLLVIDEAYIDFTSAPSLLADLPSRPNLVVLQTLSKAWGLAGVRAGMLFAAPPLVTVLDRMKAPYNMSTLNQRAALDAIARFRRKDLNARVTVSERARLQAQLRALETVQEVFPSEANFLLVRFADAAAVYARLRSLGIAVRNRSSEPGCYNCLRISIGSPAENNRLIVALRGETAEEEPQRRSAEFSRSTRETSVFVQVNLDGHGTCGIDTGLPFFDHMLELFAFHAGIDLRLSANGDLEVDSHHTIEDAALSLGEAMRAALGSKAGIERYGYVLPMDEARASVALDLSARPYLSFSVNASAGEETGGISFAMFEHFFRSLSVALGCTLQIDARGCDPHHTIEAVFKGCGRAFGAALCQDTRHRLPSTKGSF